MIARMWRGAVRREDGDAYASYMQTTGIVGYARTPARPATGPSSCCAATSATAASS
jgi:hypothetical protein